MLRSMRPPEVARFQGTLIQSTLNTEVPVEVIPSVELPPSIGNEGSYVSVAERATHLDVALAAIGQRNQRLGFDVASNSRQYRRPIDERYQPVLSYVQEGAAANSDKFLEDAKRSFWRATGYTALKGSSLIGTKEIDANAKKMWRDFSAKYGNPENRKRRNSYRKVLKREIKRSENLSHKDAA